MEIRIAVPRLPQGLVANLIGLAGLIAMVLAVGGLTGNWWWSVLAGGLVAFGLAMVAQLQATAEQVRSEVRPHLVAAAKASA
jgi:hypothetical protein